MGGCGESGISYSNADINVSNFWTNSQNHLTHMLRQSVITLFAIFPSHHLKLTTSRGVVSPRIEPTTLRTRTAILWLPMPSYTCDAARATIPYSTCIGPVSMTGHWHRTANLDKFLHFLQQYTYFVTFSRVRAKSIIDSYMSIFFATIWPRQSYHMQYSHKATGNIQIIQTVHIWAVKFTRGQGLSQDFKTARPTQRRFQDNPSNTILGISIHTAREPGSDPVLREKRNTVQWKRPWVAITAATAYKVTCKNTPFWKEYKAFY